MLAYSMLPFLRSPWAVLPVELLHGVTFGLGWGVGTTQCKQLAPVGSEVMLQSVFQAAYFGLGYGIGALTGGFFSDSFGFPVMYVCGAGFLALGWVAVAFARAWAANRTSTRAATYQQMGGLLIFPA